MRRWALGLPLVLAALAGCLLATAPAGAAVGELSFQGCIAKAPGPADCVGVAGAALDDPAPIAISPDGASLYVATDGSESLTHLTRAEDGTLGFGSCLARPNEPDCDPVPGLPIRVTRSIVVSPDGQSVYANSRSFSAVSHFVREPETGRLAFGDCLTSSPLTFGCTFVGSVDAGQGPLRLARGLAVAPDGGSIYVAGPDLDTLSELSPTEPTGELAFAGCLGNDGLSGCADLPQMPFRLPAEPVVSPDGSSVHLGSSGGSVASFSRGVPLSAADFLGCLGGASPSSPCAPAPVAALEGLIDIAISPDGRSVYAVSSLRSVLTHFSRSSDGLLAFEACFSSDAVPGCVDLPASPLLTASSVAVAPDGDSVYVAAFESEAISHFDRGADGSLAYRGCHSASDLGGDCADVPSGVMDEALAIAVSPDGTSLYVTAPASDSIVAFQRTPAEPDHGEPEPKEPEQPRPNDPQPPDPPPPGPGVSCAGRLATIVGTARADTLRGTAERDVIAGLGGADTIRGRGGNDLICGGGGKDRILGGAGKDRIRGEAGRDTILGGGGRDRCTGGPGRDEEACEPVPRRAGAG